MRSEIKDNEKGEREKEDKCKYKCIVNVG